MKEGEKRDFDLIHFTGDGRGVAKAEKLIIIDGVEDTDECVRAVITKVFEEVAFAEKVSKKSKPEKETTLKKNLQAKGPYEVDDD